MKLKPLNNSFLFSFASDTHHGLFIEKNSGHIILTNRNYEDQGKYARWGKVEAIGRDVVDFKVGDLVLIHPLKWTKELRYEGQSYWKSDDTQVLAIGKDESVTYAY